MPQILTAIAGAAATAGTAAAGTAAAVGTTAAIASSATIPLAAKVAAATVPTLAAAPAVGTAATAITAATIPSTFVSGLVAGGRTILGEQVSTLGASLPTRAGVAIGQAGSRLASANLLSPGGEPAPTVSGFAGSAGEARRQISGMTEVEGQPGEFRLRTLEDIFREEFERA